MGCRLLLEVLVDLVTVQREIRSSLREDAEQRHAIARSLTRLEHDGETQERALETIMINTDALVASIDKVKQDDALIIAALQESRNNAAELAVKLQKAIDDLAALPADTAAVETVLASAVADLNKIATDTETAVPNNQAVADLPPAEVVNL